MADFSTYDIFELLTKLQNGEIKPHHEVDGEFGSLTLLQAVLKSDMNTLTKHKTIKQMIDLGCDVDQVSSSSSVITMAASGGYNEDFKPIVEMLLENHKKGDLTDLLILKSAATSLDAGMFRLILKSNKVDINATKRGGHILHFLAEEVVFSRDIDDVFNIFPSATPNPINRKGLSPMAVALNQLNQPGVEALLKHPDTKIIGYVGAPELIIDMDIFDRYEGNFFEEFPHMVPYAVSKGRSDLLPKEVTDIFLF